MLRFDSDYMEGAHSAILARLAQNNLEKMPGYGEDEICALAKEKILSACECEDGEVHFLVGGTQTNATVIAALLRPYQAVVSADSAHIATHEAGAIEAAGHKVIPIEGKNGLVDAHVLRAYLERFYDDPTYMHTPIPGMVFVSHPSEIGTVYTRESLEAVAAVCREYGLLLYLDGARLAYGLASKDTDLTLADIARLCDAFYIGGTKCGALFGEAVVFPKKNTCPHFFTTIKQRGALLAKGWLLGIQFDTLFTEDLYLRLGENALEKARRLRKIFLAHGYTLYTDSPTNQQFFILTNAQHRALSEKMSYVQFGRIDKERIIARFVTSWATTDAQLDALESTL